MEARNIRDGWFLRPHGGLADSQEFVWSVRSESKKVLSLFADGASSCLLPLRRRDDSERDGSLNRYCFLRRRLRVRRRLDAAPRRAVGAPRRAFLFAGGSQNRLSLSLSLSFPLVAPLYLYRSIFLYLSALSAVAPGSSLDEGQDTRNLHLPEVVARHLRISVPDLPRIDESAAERSPRSKTSTATAPSRVSHFFMTDLRVYR